MTNDQHEPKGKTTFLSAVAFIVYVLAFLIGLSAVMNLGRTGWDEPAYYIVLVVAVAIGIGANHFRAAWRK